MFSIRIILHPIKVLFLLAFSINPNNLFFPGKTTTNYRFSDCSASISPRSSEGIFEMQSSSTMVTSIFVVKSLIPNPYSVTYSLLKLKMLITQRNDGTAITSFQLPGYC